ncbi:PEP-CTERM sorting domain-containing protein [Rubritalea marina]|uniref:PEP-CTERM sorting domain-containing protein n=1 Tax=Rubritalea marina TaxID=361055 RepID=UPI00039DD774|nr:PEP-CTERM sorting domain-containing protein [Rubritalea marina]
MKIITSLLLVAGAGLCSASTVSVGFFSSVETYSYQTDESSSTIVSYDGFDDVSGPMDGESDAFTGEWIPGGESEYYGVKINGGVVDEIPYSTQYELWKRGHNYDTEAEMLAVRPVDATYTHVLHLKDEDAGSPNFVDLEVDITAPDVAFNTALPANPTFSINGVDGVWSTGHDGIGVFTFDPTSVSEFTVTMSLYNTTHQGTNYVYAATVGTIDGAYESVDQESSGILDVDPGDIGEALAEVNQITLTFTKGLAVNGGDTDATTYGFGNDSAFELEGEFVNAWIEDDATAATALDVDEVTKGFVYQTVTSFQLRADVALVPEPSSLSLLGFGSLVLMLRRKRT